MHAPVTTPRAAPEALEPRLRRALMPHVVTAALLPALFVALPLPLAVLFAAAAVVVEIVVLCTVPSPRVWAARAATVVVVVAGAVAAPLGYADRVSVDGLPTHTVTLRELNERIRAGEVHAMQVSTLDPALLERQVRFSSTRMSLRAYVDELEPQVDGSLVLGTCGHDASLLFGAAPMDLSVRR